MDKSYLALLRGINVGGNNLIRMAELKKSFEQLGFAGVSTFIQSGNVLFRTAAKDTAGLASTIESALSERFRYQSKIVVVSETQLAYAVDRAPAGFGKEPGAFRYDVIFLRPPVRPASVIGQVPTAEGVDCVDAGRDVLYFSRLIAKASKSRLAKIASLPVYKELTIRNWNTTTTLLKLMRERA